MFGQAACVIPLNHAREMDEAPRRTARECQRIDSDRGECHWQPWLGKLLGKLRMSCRGGSVFLQRSDGPRRSVHRGAFVTPATDSDHPPQPSAGRRRLCRRPLRRRRRLRRRPLRRRRAPPSARRLLEPPDPDDDPDDSEADLQLAAQDALAQDTFRAGGADSVRDRELALLAAEFSATRPTLRRRRRPSWRANDGCSCSCPARISDPPLPSRHAVRRTWPHVYSRSATSSPKGVFS